MQKGFELRYLKRSEIDTSAWDVCIAKSPQGLIYARSFYLDHMAGNWDALVLNDYEAVMPLPWRKKWSIAYVYQLPFVQRLGVYGLDIDDETATLFYSKAVQFFPFINYKTNWAAGKKMKVLRTCTNLVIDLSPTYAELKNNFTPECLKNIKKAETRGCLLLADTAPGEVTSFFKKAYGSYYISYTDTTYKQLETLIEEAQKKGFCKTYSVTNIQGTTVFTAALFQDEKRIYYCVGAPNEEGRKMRAPYFFINEIIRQNASQPLLFDFEGSDLPNVASFYRKFSPVSETYFEVLINRLPLPLRWLKKN